MPISEQRQRERERRVREMEREEARRRVEEEELRRQLRNNVDDERVMNSRRRTLNNMIERINILVDEGLAEITQNDINELTTLIMEGYGNSRYTRFMRRILVNVAENEMQNTINYVLTGRGRNNCSIL